MDEAGKNKTLDTKTNRRSVVPRALRIEQYRPIEISMDIVPFPPPFQRNAMLIRISTRLF